jgi:hypothetical protein
VKPIVAAAALSLIAGSAVAQGMPPTTTTTTTVTPGMTTTTIAPGEETEMHEYIVREHRASIAPPPGFTVTTGAVLPSSVTLYSFPTERHWGDYEYTVIGDQPVVVDPGTRRVIDIIR